MPHLSEDAHKLKTKNINELEVNSNQPNVWFIHLPYFISLNDIVDKTNLYEDLNCFINKIPDNSTILILTSPVVAADYLSDYESKETKINLWISIKLNEPIKRQNNLEQHHATLVILTKYSSSLKHTKTRIGYTYCPACNKTTKDYGGKKHLYHEFGTLMSDVWRDINYDPNGDAENIINRLTDLFGIKGFYSHLFVMDLRRTLAMDFENRDNPLNLMNLETNDFIYNGQNESLLINGDSLEVLQNIPTGSIDYCFADPPYNLKKKYETWDDDLDIEDYFSWCDRWISEISRVLKPGGILSILNIPLWSIRHFKHLKSIGELQFHDWITWEGLSLPVRMIMPSNYVIINFSKGQSKTLPLTGINDSFNESIYALKESFCSRKSCVNKRKKNLIQDRELITNLWWDVHRLKHNSRRVDHPCQLPPLLMKRLIETYTNKGDIVLDPFNGAGTTTLVADLLQRKYVGIELDNYYHNIAKERHVEISSGIDPFRKNDDVPKSKNSTVLRMNGKYNVSKKKLQLYIKDLSIQLGHLPNRDEVVKDDKFPIEYFDNYFLNWAEVCAAARTTGMTELRTETVKE